MFLIPQFCLYIESDDTHYAHGAQVALPSSWAPPWGPGANVSCVSTGGIDDNLPMHPSQRVCVVYTRTGSSVVLRSSLTFDV
jgi:hypothetical protein